LQILHLGSVHFFVKFSVVVGLFRLPKLAVVIFFVDFAVVLGRELFSYIENIFKLVIVDVILDVSTMLNNVVELEISVVGCNKGNPIVFIWRCRSRTLKFCIKKMFFDGVRWVNTKNSIFSLYDTKLNCMVTFFFV